MNKIDSSPRSSRYASLDLWRGVACLAVVLYHAGERGYPWLLRSDVLEPGGRFVLWTTLWGWVGVPLFFVISGYCIAASADSARNRPGVARSYAIARLRRIFPPFWAAIALTTIALTVLGPEMFHVDNWGPIPSPTSLSPSQWLGNLSLTDTWIHHLSPRLGEPRLLLGPSWTLCYELQFYAVVGLFVALIPRRLFQASAAMVVLTIMLSPLRLTRVWPLLDGTILDGRWPVFAIGILAYHQVQYRSLRLVPWILIVSSAAIVATGLSRFHLALEMAIALGFGALLCLGHSIDGVLARSWLARPLLACGTICYSLYLVHWPIVRVVSKLFATRFGEFHVGAFFVSMLAGTLASILAGLAFHLAIERRFLGGGSTVSGDFRAKVAIARPIPREVAIIGSHQG